MIISLDIKKICNIYQTETLINNPLFVFLLINNGGVKKMSLTKIIGAAILATGIGATSLTYGPKETTEIKLGNN